MTRLNLLKLLEIKIIKSEKNEKCFKINFFLGNKLKSKRQLLREALKGLWQIKKGNAKQILSIDKNLKKTTIKEFLSEK